MNPERIQALNRQLSEKLSKVESENTPTSQRRVVRPSVEEAPKVVEKKPVATVITPPTFPVKIEETMTKKNGFKEIEASLSPQEEEFSEQDLEEEADEELEGDEDEDDEVEEDDEEEIEEDEEGEEGEDEAESRSIPVERVVAAPPPMNEFEDPENSVVPPTQAPRRRGRPPKVQHLPPNAVRVNRASARVPPPQILRGGSGLAAVQRLQEDYAEMLAGLDFTDGGHSISLKRVSPEFDPNNPDNRIAGHLETFTTPVTPEDIKKKYGGGVFEATIYGPPFPGAQGRKRKGPPQRFEIAGPPIGRVDPRAAAAEAARNKATDQALQADLLKEIMTSKDRDLKRAMDEAAEAKRTLMATLAKTSEGSMSQFSTILSALNPSSGMEKLQMMMMEQQRASEARAAQEREARRDEMRMMQQQHEKQLELARQQHELMLEQMKNDRERAEREARESARREQERAEKSMQEMMRLEAERNRMHSENMARLFEVSQKAADDKSAFLLRQLEMQKKDDFSTMLDKMVRMKEAVNTLSGNVDEREGWEKAIDKIGDMLGPVAAPIAARFMGGGGPPQPQQVQARVNNTQPRIAPNSVAVVDMPVAVPRRKKRKKPTTEATPQEKKEQVPASPNTVTEFVFPDQSTDIETQFQALVQNIDLALQKDYSVRRAYDEVVNQFPQATIALLKIADMDMINTALQGVPEGWLIKMPAGLKFVEELLEMIKKQP